MRRSFYIVALAAILLSLLFGWRNWEICFCISVAILILSVCLWYYYRKRSLQRSGESAGKGSDRWSSFRPSLLYMLIGGIFLSAWVCILPIYGNGDQLSGGLIGWKSLVFSFHYAFQMFTLDAGEDLFQSIHCTPAWLTNIYVWYLTVELTVAPILTFGFIVSFFKNFTGYVRYLFHYFSDAYIFSSLDEKSIALAESIRSKHADALIVFTDVFERNEEPSYEMMGRAQRLHAICFKKDVLVLNFDRHSDRAKMFFFAIGDDETENINQSLKLIESYKWRGDQCRLYVFSTRPECELLLNKVDQGDMLVRRIDVIQSMFYQNLFDRGPELFRDAKEANGAEAGDGDIPISAVIVGMGRHGTEVLKALSWYCQMDGYRLYLDAFDKDESARDRFTALCPELMSDEYNGQDVEGYPRYTIQIHSKIDVTTQTFVDEIMKLRRATYVFVSLGTDEMNIRTAVTLRMLFERMPGKRKPKIETVVYNSDEAELLAGIVNYKGEPYNINFIGDIQKTYAEDVVMNSRLEQAVLKVHSNWESYVSERQKVVENWKDWKYEYNYRSSCAATIHCVARAACGIQRPEMSDEEVNKVADLEHRRWTAYMRSEGYIYSGHYDPSTRNNLGKVHHCMVNCGELEEDDREKDRNNVRQDMKWLRDVQEAAEKKEE